MADGEEGEVHAAFVTRSERAALVGRDVVGRVAFDFVLRVAFRRRDARDPCSRSRVE